MLLFDLLLQVLDTATKNANKNHRIALATLHVNSFLMSENRVEPANTPTFPIARHQVNNNPMQQTQWRLEKHLYIHTLENNLLLPSFAPTPMTCKTALCFSSISTTYLHKYATGNVLFFRIFLSAQWEDQKMQHARNERNSEW